MLKTCWWMSVQWKQGGIREMGRGRTDWVNMIQTDSICRLTNNFSSRYIMGKLWAVAWGELFINKTIAGEMQHSTRYISFGRMREASAWIFPGSTLPTGWISIGQKGNQSVQIIIYTIIDDIRNWPYNNSKWASMEREWFLVLRPG
jgi:hypothetical protein